MESYITADHLIYEYETRDGEGNVTGISRAINDLSLSINPGEFVAVLGHNGSGKSTFAKHLNAILTPSQGSVYVDGKNTADLDKIWDIRQNTGMVFQNPDNQIVGTIVEEDVAFGPENLGIPTEEIRKRVKESIEKVGMSEYAKHSPNKLSGGQKQRVAIAGVLAMRSKCIILDEPTAMLDPNGRKEVIKTILELKEKENIAVILITHYMDEVINADTVYVMDGGEVVLKGSPREVFSQVELLKQYRLEVPQVTMLAHELQKKGVNIPSGILSIEELMEVMPCP